MVLFSVLQDCLDVIIHVFDLISVFFLRDKREQELEYFVKNKYNRLGRKIQKRMDQLNSLKTDPKLILK